MLVSRDGHSALVQFNVRGDMMQTMDRVAPVLRAVASVQKSHQGFRVEEFGTASFGKAANDSAGKDFSHAEILAIPVTVLILLLAFGAFLAAILPVVLALTAFFAATGLVFITSNLFPIDHSTFSVMLLIGLAVGVDYSLFYIRREREERAAGRSADAALQAAAATSGRSVLISGLTVIVAVAGLFFTGTGEFRGIAAGTMIVVATSVLGSVTVLPALLSKLGDRIEKGRLPLAAPPPPTQPREPLLERGPHTGAATPGDRSNRRDDVPGRARDAGPAAAHRPAGNHRLPEVDADPPDRGPHPERLPRRTDARPGRRQGRQHRHASDPRTHSSASGPRRWPPASSTTRSPSTSSTGTSRSSPRRSPAPARTPAQTRRCRRCARTSSPRPSLRPRACRPSPSEATPHRPRTTTTP